MSSGLMMILKQANIITEEDCLNIETAITDDKISVISAVAKIKKNVSLMHITEVIAEFYAIPILDIDAYNLDYIPKNFFNAEFISQNKVLPLAIHHQHLKLAVSDPTNTELFSDIAFKNNLSIDLILIEEHKLHQLINNNSITSFSDISLESRIDVSETHNLVNISDDDQPIVKFIHKIILDAVRCAASDIHFEPYEKFYRVRYRIDGMLKEVAAPPISFRDTVAARIKIISKLDISEKRVPQDGRMRIAISENNAIDFRVSTLPTPFGEKIVMRILDSKSSKLGIDILGFSKVQKKVILETINRPYGMILVTGPTGSGKTVTLYTFLNMLNDITKNIATAEDPVEIALDGINQVAINDRTGLTFAVALRAFLRQDPDIIMLGEIRDTETAEISVKAAQTGHLVLSTLHTNDASSALTRLVSMGIPTYNVGDAILLIIAQRLARKLCNKCKQKIKVAEHDFERLKINKSSDSVYIYKAIGCHVCHGTGYSGRIGIFEVMPISDQLKSMIINKEPSFVLSHQARQEGILSLRESGLEKVLLGLTSIAEIELITNE